MKHIWQILAGLALTLAMTVPVVHADTIDFSGLADGTAVTNQYSGVVFSLEGGPDSAGPPTINSYEGLGGALSNSTNAGYPTANILDIAFASPVSGLSFTFDNEGDNSTTFYNASNGSTANISADGDGTYFSLVSVAGSGITDLQINNDEGPSTSWYFDIQSITYTPSAVAVPEPGSISLLALGLVGVVLMMVLRKRIARGLPQAT